MKNMEHNNMKYEEALARLDELVAAIEDPQRDFTGIADDVKKAMELVKWCRNYIRKGEEDIEKLIKDDE